jgi:hypothetical protein
MTGTIRDKVFLTVLSVEARSQSLWLYSFSMFKSKAGNTKVGITVPLVDLLFDSFGISCMTFDNFGFFIRKTD